MASSVLLLSLLSLSGALPASSSDAANYQNSSSIPGQGSASHQVVANGSVWPYQTYKSSPQNPPNLTISANGQALSPGYAFFSPSGPATAAKQSGGLIMTPHNDLIYGLPVTSGEITDFRVQEYGGKPYITYWDGETTSALNVGHGYGKVTLLDSGYRAAHVVCPDLDIYIPTDDGKSAAKSPNCTVDLHEHQVVTSRGTMLVTAYNTTRADLRSVGGPASGWVANGMFFEVDIATNKVLFAWSALAHVPVNATHVPLGASGANSSAPFDYFHPNSVAPLGDDYLVNARHTWTTYLVSGRDGSIIWAIDGQTGGDFGPLPPNGTFRWQHYQRPDGVETTADNQTWLTMSWFDNHNSQYDNGTQPTKGLQMRLTVPPDPARNGPPVVLRHVEVAADPVYVDSQGTFEPTGFLPDGSRNQFMGYGQVPIMREYGSNPEGDDLRWEARFGGTMVQSYRAFKQTWKATPAEWDPSLVVDGRGSAYVSWNGATEVTAWAVYVGEDEAAMKMVGRVRKWGFETRFNVPVKGCVQVGALEGGKEVRRSNVVCA